MEIKKQQQPHKYVLYMSLTDSKVLQNPSRYWVVKIIKKNSIGASLF